MMFAPSQIAVAITRAGKRRCGPSSLMNKVNFPATTSLQPKWTGF